MSSRRCRVPLRVLALAGLAVASACTTTAPRASAPPPASSAQTGSSGGAAASSTSSSAASPTSPPSSTPAPSGDASAGDVVPPPMQPLVDAHNRMREAHCAPPLSWSKEIAEAAQGWADRLASRGCAIQHSQQPYGENIAAGTSGVLDAERVTERWYRERQDYDFDSGGFSMETGHFTQLVWAESRQLGCGTASCRGLDIWVCMYDPPGNMRGGYRDNVRPDTCER